MTTGKMALLQVERWMKKKQKEKGERVMPMVSRRDGAVAVNGG